MYMYVCIYVLLVCLVSVFFDFVTIVLLGVLVESSLSACLYILYVTPPPLLSLYLLSHLLAYTVTDTAP